MLVFSEIIIKEKGIDAYTKPKSILAVNEKGINLPDDVTSFQIDARIAVEQNGKLEYLKKKENVAFSHQVIFDDFVEDKKVVEDIVGKKVEKISDKIRAFSRANFEKFSKLIKFKPIKKDELSL